MNDVKSYASSITENYTSALKRLEKKYQAKRGRIENEYRIRNKKIQTDNQNMKNELSANYKMGLENANNALAEKGIGASGTAVNTEISSNLSKSRAISSLNEKMQDALNKSFAIRAQELSQLESDNEKSHRELSANLSCDLLAAEKLDMEYEQKKSESEEDRRRWEVENERKIFESDRDYSLAKEKQELDAYKAYSTSEKSSSKTSTGSDKSTKDDDKGIPSYTPDELVRAMYTAVMRKDYESDAQREGALKAAIQAILLDTSLAPSFKRDLRVYASALGYI